MQQLIDYLRLLFPNELEENEYIRLFFKKEGDKEVCKVEFVKTFEEVRELVNKYRNFFNCYVSLATYIGNDILDKKSMHLYRRNVIFLDFDKKDFPDFSGAADYTAHIKELLPSLYNHAVVASGSGGVHIYSACETADPKEIAKLNLTIANIVHADTNACLPTQVARLPTSYNLKNNEKHGVIVVNNDVNKANFKRYSLQSLMLVVQNAEKKENCSPPQTSKTQNKTFNANCYCVKSMLENGVNKGERNFAQGRIVQWLKLSGYTYDTSKSMVLDWNLRCNPPKNVDEVLSDFERYWNNNAYLLLGCNLPEGRNKSILANYCDKTLCKRYQAYTDNMNPKYAIYLSSKFFNKVNLRRLSAYHYVILFMLVGRKSMTESEIVDKLSGLISKRTVVEKIKELETFKLIDKSFSKISIKKINSKYNKEVCFDKYIIALFLRKKISGQQLKIYLAIRALLQIKSNAALGTLSEYTGITKSTISEHLNNLKKKGIINIDTVVNDKGLLCNHYTFNVFGNF